MSAVFKSLSLLTASLVGCATQAEDGVGGRRTQIVVNSVRLSQDTLQSLEQLLRVRLRPGRYWYDARSGLAGVVVLMRFGNVPPVLGKLALCVRSLRNLSGRYHPTMNAAMPPEL